MHPHGADNFDLDYYGLLAKTTKSVVVDLGENTESTHALWQRIRVEYSQKALTRITDKLAAFSGIARMAHKLLRLSEDNYLAGLGKQDLLQELLWERYEDQGQPHDPDLYIAPTWSWASINSYFWYLDPRLRFENYWHVNVLDTKISPIDDTFGPVKSGSLVVQCSLCYVTMTLQRPMSSDWISRQLDWSLSTINGVSVTCGCSVSLDHLLPVVVALHTSMSYYFIPMKFGFEKKELRYTKVTRLLLHMTQRVRGQYYRVGLLDVYTYSIDQHVILLLLKSRENIGTNWYLENQPDSLCAIEII